MSNVGSNCLHYFTNYFNIPTDLLLKTEKLTHARQNGFLKMALLLESSEFFLKHLTAQLFKRHGCGLLGGFLSCIIRALRFEQALGKPCMQMFQDESGSVHVAVWCRSFFWGLVCVCSASADAEEEEDGDGCTVQSSIK